MKEKREKEHDLTHLYAALGAVAFFVAGVPILDAFSNWVSNVFGFKSAKLNHETSKYTEDDAEECHTQAVGFRVPNEESEECFEDE